MAENDQGANSGEQQVKTYTETEVQEMIAKASADAEKKGQTAAHSHWQSVADKSIATLKNEYESKLGQQNQTIAELRKAQLDSMSPEDRSLAILEDVRNMLSGQGANNASDKSQANDQLYRTPVDQGPAQDETAAVAQLRKEVADTLQKQYGVDPSKIDWADGEQGTTAMNKFLGSVLSQIGTQGDQGDQGDDPNHVDTRNSGGGNVFDPKTADPASLIRQGAGTVRMAPEGGYRAAPWLN